MAAAIPEDIYLREDKIQSAFLLFDRGKTGKVSKDELKNALGSINSIKILFLNNKEDQYYQMKEDTYWEKIIEDCDFNKDGYLDKEDFKSVLEKE